MRARFVLNILILPEVFVTMLADPACVLEYMIESNTCHQASLSIRLSPPSVSVMLGTSMTLSDNTPLSDSTIYRIQGCVTVISNDFGLSEVPSHWIVKLP